MQGAGLDKEGNSGTIREADVIIMSNKECRERVKHNSTSHGLFNKYCQDIVKGVTEDLLCTRGIYNHGNPSDSTVLDPF